MKIDIKLMLALHAKWLRGEGGGERADLRCANLSYANLRCANLSYANLRYADLRYANLIYANLRYADLSYANLSYANLRFADLSYAKKSAFSIVPQEGAFIGWKKTTEGVIKILIPEDAKRISSLIGRKCRASKIEVLSGKGCGGKSPTHGEITYEKGKTIEADSFDDDIRAECTHGIHFFMTKEEAEEW